MPQDTQSSKLHALASAGQSVWLDALSREMLSSGALAAHVEDNAVTGVTSNPSIFAAALRAGDSYDRQVAEMAGRGASAEEIYTAVVTQDIRGACDELAPVFDRSEGADGFVSVEVSPELADDPEGTAQEARDWVKRVDRPNLLIKVPATAAGLGAIEALTAEGVSVNVTLIFSLARYRKVMEAYISGLERFRAVGGDLSGTASVASFFVSRVDSEVDARLEKIGSEEALRLRGRAAVANARAAYLEFLRTFSSRRWRSLQAAGGRVQRPLWASTSAKNPDYSPTLYVDTLVAPCTVNTMPESTIDAYRLEGPDRPQVLNIEQMNEALETLEALAGAGIDLGDVTGVLEGEGVAKFADAHRQMMGDIEAERLRLFQCGLVGVTDNSITKQIVDGN